MDTTIAILLALIVGMLGFVAGMMVSRRPDPSRPDAAVSGTLETLSARLVEPPVAQPDFFPWTQLLNSEADRGAVVEEMMRARATDGGSLIEQVRFLACAQMATNALLVELVEWERSRATTTEPELAFS